MAGPRVRRGGHRIRDAAHHLFGGAQACGDSRRWRLQAASCCARVGGAVVIGVAISHWLLVITLLGAVPRAGQTLRQIATLADGGTGHRPILAHYSTDLLDQLITIVASSTLLAHAFYTISPDTVAKFGTDRLLFTLPFPLYGVFRYLYLIHKHDGGRIRLKRCVGSADSPLRGPVGSRSGGRHLRALALTPGQRIKVLS